MDWYIWLTIALICFGAVVLLLTPVCAWIKKKWKNREITYCKHSKIIDGNKDFRWRKCKKNCEDMLQ